MNNLRTCPVCGTTVKGRSDKKYCCKKCKSIDQYENRQKSEGFYIRVDRQLKINRKILKRYNKSGYSVIRKNELLEEGFNPKFFTHYWKNKKEDIYLFVYEFGFLSKKDGDKEKYVLVTWQDYMN
ncbi:hypothetical protein [Ulvibacterium sp.]|uniref:hypothetical protein n=1 Tax=Ulvibacterium sp. TaxID=2665914 RepID=UPI00260F4174|nr:hypothetical protein [Ulvibacterium sp.]